FSGWSGACTGTGSCVVPMTAATTVTANFDPVPYTLSVTKAGTGTGTVTSTPAGINCGMTCTQTYAPGTVVTLSATAPLGSTLTGWSGACTGTGSCSVTVDSAKSVTASFAPASTLTVYKLGEGGGVVTSSPAGISCGATCAYVYANSTVITLTATPVAGSTFTGWSRGYG